MGKQTEPQKHEHEEEVPMDPLTPQAPSKNTDSVKKKPFSSTDAGHPRKSSEFENKRSK